jgi:hypothetical protein
MEAAFTNMEFPHKANEVLFTNNQMRVSTSLPSFSLDQSGAISDDFSNVNERRPLWPRLERL